jgi:hypothetical protein
MKHQNTPTLPADTTTTTPITSAPTRADRDELGTTWTPGEGVNAMARKLGRPRVKRAWDEMSETDRQVLLETVRQRREAQAVRDAQQLQVMSQRAYR